MYLALLLIASMAFITAAIDAPHQLLQRQGCDIGYLPCGGDCMADTSACCPGDVICLFGTYCFPDQNLGSTCCPNGVDCYNGDSNAAPTTQAPAEPTETFQPSNTAASEPPQTTGASSSNPTVLVAGGKNGAVSISAEKGAIMGSIVIMLGVALNEY